MNCRDDLTWANQHLEAIRLVMKQVAQHVIEIVPATTAQDQHEATDYVVKVTSGDVAVRIRRQRYADLFGDVTLRLWRSSGAKTEVEKLKAGFARWYLYAWSPNGVFTSWVFLDCDRMRASDVFQHGIPINNTDGQSGFLALSIPTLRDHGCIVEEWNIQKNEAHALQ